MDIRYDDTQPSAHTHVSESSTLSIVPSIVQGNKGLSPPAFSP